MPDVVPCNSAVTYAVPNHLIICKAKLMVCKPQIIK